MISERESERASWGKKECGLQSEAGRVSGALQDGGLNSSLSWGWGLCGFGDQVQEVRFNGGKEGMAELGWVTADRHPPEATGFQIQADLSFHR